MIDRRLFPTLVALAALCASPAFAAKKKTSTAPAPSTPAPSTPAPAARPDSSALAATTPLGIAPTPGPVVPSGSPVRDRTTIAPFPIPGDTGRVARERAKMMNLPRQGVTTVEPLSPPGAFSTLPQALSGPGPVYPEAARDAGVQGTVLVMALVLANGSVGETHIIHSIPALDTAAVLAVKRMRFRPASFRGEPASDWVGIPVRFTLH